MTETEMFWQYADEAMRCARLSKSAGEKRALTDIAFSWSQAALHSEEREGKPQGPSIKSH
jgi:hypothetical protein